MPLTSPSSYIVSIPLFQNHWADANPEAPGDEFVLDKDACGQSVDVSLDLLNEMFDSLLAVRNTVEEALLDAGLAQALTLQDKVWLNARLVKFNQSVRADHGTTQFASHLEPVPQPGDAPEKFSGPVRRTATLWAKLNTWRAAQSPAKPALTLGDGTTLAQFSTRLGQLTDHAAAVEEREQQAGLHRAQRNSIQDQLYLICKVYRLKVQALFAADSALVATLPSLTEDGGATPEAGTLTGSYNGTTVTAELTGTPSPTAGVVRHQIRASTAPVPDVDDEGLRAEFAVGEPIVLSTNYGLGTPGAVVHFRLVAITEDGHEKGSPWVTIQRPL